MMIFTLSLPLLTYSPKSQNHRVPGYEIPGEEQPKIFTTEGSPGSLDLDNLILAAYRQVFNEQQMLVRNRQKVLESQLRNGVITVRDFVRGLALSETFRRHNYEPNNNYRFTEMCFQRFLGRQVYNDQEKIAWSILLATKGLEAFMDALLNSEEYLDNFGYDVVPYQRRRILPQRTQGALPFSRMPRYDADYRNQLEELGYFQNRVSSQYRWHWQQQPYPDWFYKVGKGIAISGAGILLLIILATALAAWEIIPL